MRAQPINLPLVKHQAILNGLIVHMQLVRKYLFFELFLDFEIDGLQESLLLAFELKLLPELFVSELLVNVDGDGSDLHVLLADSEVFAGCPQEGLLVADDLPVECVDYGVGFVPEAIDAAHLLQVAVPFRRVLDDDSEVDVRVLCLDLLRDLLAVGCVEVVRGPSNNVTTHI